MASEKGLIERDQFLKDASAQKDEAAGTHPLHQLQKAGAADRCREAGGTETTVECCSGGGPGTGLDSESDDEDRAFLEEVNLLR